MNCWNCKEACEHAICVSCGSVQPPPPQPNPFHVLRLRHSYFLEPQEIEKAYRTVSRKLHPDRFVRANAVTRRMVLQWMAAVNTSRKVLLNDSQRARWMATGQAEPAEEKMSHDSEFLEMVFELQSQSMDEPEASKAGAQQLMSALKQQIETCFRDYEAGIGHLNAVPELLDQMQYLHKMRILTE
ncbi:MAG: hypothetical protein VXZ96_14445 [Myxococcota bacterium]|nr:hypothetical protein [Myxococcota bacterium]MEC8381526.1 hypothetical protein [Myxococcota bacterium]